MPEAPPSPGDVLIDELTIEGNQIVARLAKAINAPTDDVITLADLVECDFPGYASVPLNDYEDVDPDAVDNREVLSAIVEFIAAGITTPQSAVAFYITGKQGAGAVGLIDLEVFNGEFHFAKDDDKLQRQVRFNQSLDS